MYCKCALQKLKVTNFHLEVSNTPANNIIVKVANIDKAVCILARNFEHLIYSITSAVRLWRLNNTCKLMKKNVTEATANKLVNYRCQSKH